MGKFAMHRVASKFGRCRKIGKTARVTTKCSRRADLRRDMNLWSRCCDRSPIITVGGPTFTETKISSSVVHREFLPIILPRTRCVLAFFYLRMPFGIVIFKQLSRTSARRNTWHISDRKTLNGSQ